MKKFLLLSFCAVFFINVIAQENDNGGKRPRKRSSITDKIVVTFETPEDVPLQGLEVFATRTDLNAFPDTIHADIIEGNSFTFKQLPAQIWYVFAQADGIPLQLFQVLSSSAEPTKLYTFTLKGYDPDWKNKPKKEFSMDEVKMIAAEWHAGVAERNMKLRQESVNKDKKKKKKGKEKIE